MLLYICLKPFIISFFLQAVSLRQFVTARYFLALVCGQWLHQFVANFIWYAEKWSPEKWSPGKMVPGKIVPRKNCPRKNGPRKNGPREKWSPEKWSLEKWLSYGFLSFASSMDENMKKWPQTETGSHTSAFTYLYMERRENWLKKWLGSINNPLQLIRM